MLGTYDFKLYCHNTVIIELPVTQWKTRWSRLGFYPETVIDTKTSQIAVRRFISIHFSPPITQLAHAHSYTCALIESLTIHPDGIFLISWPFLNSVQCPPCSLSLSLPRLSVSPFTLYLSLSLPFSLPFPRRLTWCLFHFITSLKQPWNAF